MSLADLIRTPLNLYRNDGATLGVQLDGDGVEQYAPSSLATAPFAVEPSTAYKLTEFPDDGNGYASHGDKSVDGNARVNLYDSTGTLVRYISWATSFTTAADEVSVRLSGFNVIKAKRLMLTKGTVNPSVFTPYHHYTPNPDFRSEKPVIRGEGRRYEGKRVALLSDSLGVSPSSWWSHIMEPLGFLNSPWLDNEPSIPAGQRYAIGGSAVEERKFYGVEAGNDHSVSHAWLRIQALDAARDVSFVGNGTNGWGSPFNPLVQASKDNPATVGDFATEWAAYRADVANGTSTVDGTTTYGAAILLCHHWTLKYPNKPKFWIGPPPRRFMWDRLGKIGNPVTEDDWAAYRNGGAAMVPDGEGGYREHKFYGDDLFTYAERLEAVAARFGIPFYNALKRSTLFPWNATDYEDPVHLTPAGSAKLGRDVLRWVLSYGL